MNATTPHPAPGLLAAFGNGMLSDADLPAVAAHLETCASCRRIAAAPAPDNFIRLIQAVRPGGAGVKALDVPRELLDHPRYRVVGELGRGGMGVVYEAEHRVMDRREALKVISKDLVDRPEVLARFHAEVKVAARLNHPNIVQAYDADQVGDLHLLVMEYVEGTDLARLVRQQGPLPVGQACDWVCQAAQGLQYAHEQQMVHRDIKPQNLMLTPQGQVKILDFGLARVRSERGTTPGLTNAGAFMGTPEYVAPEQAVDAHTADIRADIYSLGCTLYCLLTGRPPFVEDTPLKAIMAHREKEAAPLHEVRPEVPEALSAVVATMLAKDPAQRYQTPAEVVKALAPFRQAVVAAQSPAAPLEVSSPATGTVPPVGTGTVPELKEASQASASKGAPGTKAKGSAATAFWWGGWRQRGWRLSALAAVAVLLAVVPIGYFLGGTILRLATNKGELVIKTDDRDIEVTVKQEGRQPQVVIVDRASKREIVLHAGDYDLDVRLKDTTGESHFLTKHFTLTRAGKVVLDLQLEAAPNPPRPQPPPPDRPGREPQPKSGEVRTLALGMKFAWIPPGTFLMGTSREDFDRESNETQHQVEITRPFYLGVFEVTQEEYEKVMGSNPSWYSSSGGGKDKVQGQDTRRFPVEVVSWEKVVEFCKKLSELPEEKRAGRLYRLPTEAEWEYACRAGTTTPFPEGVSLSSTQANFNGDYPYGKAPQGPNLGRPTTVGSYKPNAFGLFDMAGNVSEWCADWYDAQYYKISPQRDPLGPGSPQTGFGHVARGGSYCNAGWHCRAASHQAVQADLPWANLGFRVVLDPGGSGGKRQEPPGKPSAQRKVGDVLTNSIGMKLAWIPPGTFLMGSPVEEEGRNNGPFGNWADEAQHRVTLTRGFWMGVDPLTRGQFARFVETTNYRTEAERPAGSLYWDDKLACYKSDSQRNWQEPGFDQTDEHPVVCVNLDDSLEFCDWLSRQDPEGRRYALPTECQWEYACRAGTTTPFHFGETISTDQANYNGNSVYGQGQKGVYRQGTTSVGKFPANGWGLYDMHGNVWQWCQDWYGAYPEGPATDSKGPDSGESRVIRGGPWFLAPGASRTARRAAYFPGTSADHLGLRVCFAGKARGKTEPDPRPGEVITNFLGMKCVWIGPGTFTMGSPPGELERLDNERQHQVTLTKGFWMGIFPVTRGQFARFVKATNYRTRAERPVGSYVWKNREFKCDTTKSWKNPGFDQTNDHPVVCVSWNDNKEFCDWLTRVDGEGRRYGLPTEAQWEYACRAGTTTPFFFGDTISTDQANYNGNYPYGKGKKGLDRQQTTPVGTFPANAWGLGDMHGNVAQWCQDWHGEYPRSDQVDPQGPAQGNFRVARGGNWINEARFCRSATRGCCGGGYNHVGCRLVCWAVQGPDKDEPALEPQATEPGPPQARPR